MSSSRFLLASLEADLRAGVEAAVRKALGPGPALSSSQHRAMIVAHRELVRAGVRPDAARRVVLRAAARTFGAAAEGGLGRFKLHRFVRNADTGPRPVVSGERCTALPFDAGPGKEEQLQVDLDEYRARGWTVMKINPTGDREIWYACPPGQLPRENQPLVFSAEVGQ